MVRPSFELSTVVRKLVDYLHNREQASYSEMNKVTGRIVNGKDRYVLASALKQLQREYEQVFIPERGIGVVRATNGQVASISTDSVIRKTGKAIRRARKLHPLVNIQDLPAELREQFFLGRVVTQMLDAAVGRKMRTQIANEIKERGGDMIDLEQMMALFKKRAH